MSKEETIKDNYYLGQIQNVHYYNHALTDAEVHTIHDEMGVVDHPLTPDEVRTMGLDPYAVFRRSISHTKMLAEQRMGD